MAHGPLLGHIFKLVFDPIKKKSYLKRKWLIVVILIHVVHVLMCVQYLIINTDFKSSLLEL